MIGHAVPMDLCTTAAPTVLGRPSIRAPRRSVENPAGAEERSQDVLSDFGALPPSPQVNMKPRPSSIIMSTTSTLDGWEVERYLGPISAHMVIGTGILTDFFSSFTDLFGARSNSYRNKIQEIEDRALLLLEMEARRKGAEAVIGLRVDHDEISGAGKSMMMVTAMGTAVRLRRRTPSGHDPQRSGRHAAEGQSGDSRDVVSAAEVRNEVLRERMLESAADGSLSFDEEVWRIITELQLSDVAPAVLRHHAALLKGSFHTEAELRERDAQFVQQFFRSLPPEAASQHLYEGLEHSPAAAALIQSLIVELSCADYERVLQLIRSPDRALAQRALQTLLAQPTLYHPADIELLDQLIEAISAAFPPKAVEERSRLISSKTKQVWVCVCEGATSAEVARCERCGRDRFGFLKEQLGPDVAISLLSRRREAVRRLTGDRSQESAATVPA